VSPGRWLVLTVRVPSDELAGELTEGLLALGGTAVEEVGDRLSTYVAEPTDLDGFLARVAEELSAAAGGETELRWRWQEDEDWGQRWKAGLRPRRVGERIVLTQPWNDPAPEVGRDPDDLVIVIEPATAFGTGEHPTTRGALRLMQEGPVRGRVLDVGAGSGILSIAAVLLGAHHVLAVESDGGSLETARENLARNGVEAQITLDHASVDGAYLQAARDGGFDLVVANVLSGVLVPLLPDLAASMADGGRIILGGILTEEAAAVTAASVAAGLAVESEDREEEWWSVRLKRP
jgi:ribosomal protein L11 methyltransferase